MGGDRTTELKRCIDLLNAGDDTARERLIGCAAERLRALAHDMLSRDRLRRWEETDDVLQEALFQLSRSLEDVHPATVREFLQLSAFHIRRALAKLARHYFSPQKTGAKYGGPMGDLEQSFAASTDLAAPDSTPSSIAAQSEEWLRLHEAVEGLPEDEREVTELLWFHGLTHVEAALILDVAERTVDRRWQRARLKLYQVLKGSDAGVVGS